jgi:ADP-dependent NAD(P)H-hydrate dehydratase / NAD(P)H-hydrate epimerase
LQKIVTASEMQAIDHTAIKKFGIPGLVLMENAGLAAASLIHENVPDLLEKKVLIVCGKGNNGGDGFVIARHLFIDGVQVNIFLLGKRQQLKSDARINADIAFKMGIPIHEITDKNLNAQNHLLRHCHIVVDALFGTGLSKPAGGLYEKVIKKINASKKYVFAVDIPSGVDSDSGHLIGPHIKANVTAALALLKRSHLLFPAAESMGEVQILDISIPHEAVEKQGIPVAWLELEDIQSLIPKRPTNTHKGEYGHTLVVAGSKGKGGAAGLTGLAALRAGAGLVTLAVPESCHQALEFNPLETMAVALPETKTGCVSTKAIDIILENLKGKNALAIGPGLSTDKETVQLLEALLPQVECPLVIDADGINALGKSGKLIDQIRAETVLTPHPKEMSRLSGWSVQDILNQRIERAGEFAQEHDVTLLLKGARTVVAFADGTVLINPTGNPGMATAGSGDILTGLIAGLISQGLSVPSATSVGAFIHGMAGDIYVEANHEIPLIASDLLDKVPEAIKRILA